MSFASGICLLFPARHEIGHLFFGLRWQNEAPTALSRANQSMIFSKAASHPACRRRPRRWRGTMIPEIREAS
jgi:hypothetical protein